MNADRTVPVDAMWVPVEHMLSGKATDPSATVADNRRFPEAAPWWTSEPGRASAKRNPGRVPVRISKSLWRQGNCSPPSFRFDVCVTGDLFALRWMAVGHLRKVGDRAVTSARAFRVGFSCSRSAR